VKLKHVLNNPIVSNCLCFLASLYIRFIYMTQRWEKSVPEKVQALIDEKKPIIFCFWHGRLLLASQFTPKGYRMNVIISLHKDGEWIARIVKFFRMNLIRGSSSKGGMNAVKASYEVLNKPSHCLGITPDGPRGPRMRISGNVIEIAKRTGAPIVPFTCSSSRSKHLRTWDRFLLSYPFGKAIAIFGQPLYISENISKTEIGEAEKQLEDEMNSITAYADAQLGIAKIFPADKQKQKRKGA